MEFRKDKDESWSIITKNYRTWFGFYHWWWDWALPLHVNIEYWKKEHIDVYLHILFFTFDFTRISHKYLKEVNKMFNKGSNNE